MIESACETFFYKEDLRHIEKRGMELCLVLMPATTTAQL